MTNPAEPYDPFSAPRHNRPPRAPLAQPSAPAAATPAPELRFDTSVAPPGAPGTADAGWKRSWKTTWKRFGVAYPFSIVAAVAVATLYYGAIPPSGSEDLAYYAGQFSGGVFMYGLVFGHWLDHVIARLGRWGAFGVTMGSVFILSFLAAAGVDGMPTGTYVLLTLPVAALTFLVASVIIKDSFAPRQA